MIEDFKNTLMEKPIVSASMVIIGVVIGFFASPWLRKVFKMNRF